MSFSKMNKKFEVLKLTQVPDGGGGFEDKLIKIKELWCELVPLNGREFWQAQQTQAQISHKIIIRYSKDIDRTCVFSYNNRLFDVQYITNVNEENRYLEVRALERQ